MVQEIKPFIKWTGGKGRVLNQIIPKFKDLYDNLYVEPFLGGGAVLFKLQPKNAIVADINANLIITYKIVQNSVDKLIKLLKKWQDEYPAKTPKPKDKNGKRQKDENNKNIYTPREEYFYKKRDRYNEIKFYENNIGNGETSDKNIEIAALFIFLNKTAFNGMYRENQGGKKKGRYNVPIGDYKNPSIVNEKLLKSVSKYLNENNIEILCNSYQNILEDVNNRFTDKTKKILIYLDPPYYPTETSKFTTYTSNKFAVEEQIELSKLFKQQKFPTFLSNSDCAEIRELYGDYIIFDISVMRSISAKASSRGTINEVLIKNELINDEETEEEEKEEIKIENNKSDQNTKKFTDMGKCKGKYRSGENCRNPAKENGFCGVHKNKARKVTIKYTDDDMKEDEPVKTQGIKKKKKPSIKDNVWECLWKVWDLENHDFDKEPYYFKAKDFSASHKNCEELTKFKASNMEARNLCYICTRETRPNIFIKNNLSLLSVKKNGEYAIIKGDVYIDICEIDESNIIEFTPIKLEFQLHTSTIGDSESQHLFACLNNGVFTHFIGEKGYPTMSGRKRASAFEYTFNNFEIQIEGVQIEVDLVVESKTKVAIFEAKNGKTTNTIIRQFYYPFRVISNQTDKEVIVIFFEKRDKYYCFWEYNFKNINEYDSIYLRRTSKYILKSQ